MRVAVIQGGPSAEAEVSRSSARAVALALEEAGHAALVLELDRELSRSLLEGHFDVVFPATHGRLGEDGCLQGLLEVLDIGYVGSAVRASAIASDKVSTKVFLRALGLPLAEELLVLRGTVPPLAELRTRVGAEIVVKPPLGGSAIGVSRLLGDATEEDLARAVTLAAEFGDVILVERYVRGLELTCGVLEAEAGAFALPPTAIAAEASDWYDFESKYAPGGSRHTCPAPLEPAVLAKIQELALRAHVGIGARDLSRTDMILGADGQLVVLEVNTLPGMTGVSLFPEAAAVAGIPFADLVDRLVKRAASRQLAGARALAGRPLPGA